MNGQIVRLKKGKRVFEVLTNEGSADEYRLDKLTLDQTVITPMVFKSCTKGDRYNSQDLRDAFSTDVVTEVIRIILLGGEIQHSSSERKAVIDAKRKEVLQYVHRNFIDPKSGLPHPVSRLDLAMSAKHFKVDPHLATEKLATNFIRLVEGELIFGKNELEAILTIPQKYAGSCMGTVHGMSDVKSENWASDACTWEIGIVPGVFDSFLAKLNKHTSGDYTFTLSSAPPPAEKILSGAKSKKKSKGRKGK